MRRLLFSLFLTGVLVLNSAALNYPVNAQRRQPRAPRTTASLPTQRGADKITADQLRAYLTFISSDALEGRDTPSRGLDIAAQFMALNPSRWGFKPAGDAGRSEEHTSELQSLAYLVCRLLLEKKKKKIKIMINLFSSLKKT